MKYRKKPVVIEAMQYLGMKNEVECLLFIGDSATLSDGTDGGPQTSIMIKVSGGVLEVIPNDVVIKDADGKVSICEPDIFEKTYEPVVDGVKVDWPQDGPGF